MERPSAAVTAEFVINGVSYFDTNPIARTDRRSWPTVNGVRPPNANTLTMHAEIGAMFQALEARERGGHGYLVVRGLKVCPFCRGDIKTVARERGLDSLTIADADGRTIEFDNPTELLPIKQGGKSWK